ncbi:MAG: 2,3-dehydroadipyl-CoA hydratase [Pseudomonadota bacterium]|jgi:enoyl-CoA hydratase
MSGIRSESKAEVRVLYLARSRANALNDALLTELSTAVEQAADDANVRALVLASDSPPVFCAGFDVQEVFTYDRPRMVGFFTRFVRLFERLRTLPKPVVCALTGHAYAGGAILALSADLRVMAEHALIAVNEVDLAVSLPMPMIAALGACASPELARSMLLGAEEVTAARARAGGLVSDVLPASEVLEKAVQRARWLGGKPAQAFRVHKQALDPLHGRAIEEAELEHTIDAWFGEEATRRRRVLTQRLAEKQAKRG